MTGRMIRAARLGRMPYADAWEFQRGCFRARAGGAVEDLLLLTEHPHVYTLGTSGEMDHLLAGPDELRTRGAEVYETDRGGDITYHGPGQLVGYPILDLHGYYLDLHRYLRDLEEVIIRTLADYGIAAGREPEFTGVWTGGNKIAALGVKASRWVTMHGFALNVITDLGYFDRIIPCGIFHKGVTSMEQLLGRALPLDEVADRLTGHFGDVFGASVGPIPRAELEALIEQYSQSPTTENAWQQ
jgi:lipoate-protein ligase B